MSDADPGPQLADRISQGDILRDVEYVEHVTEEDGAIVVSDILFPLVVVLTQDCDLEQDAKCRTAEPPPKTQDKRLFSVLVAPLYNIEHVYQGEHLSDLGITGEQVPRKGNAGHYLLTNQRPRFHYLELPPETKIVPSVVDFKHYFSVDAGYLRGVRETNLVYSLPVPYREDICQRFASFLSRIGLPGAHPE